MTNPTINAITMTRAIRESHAHQLRQATPAERIAFYRAKARTILPVQVEASRTPLVPQQQAS
jgi:hypothetical protein